MNNEVYGEFHVTLTDEFDLQLPWIWTFFIVKKMKNISTSSRTRAFKLVGQLYMAIWSPKSCLHCYLLQATQVFHISLFYIM